ncbi:MAG TPA: RNA-binding S4 domain-containing protein [Acidimicrobiales bacterium]|nr:RNA-binding S4 domain-containing protein [Acidimicrobiales bacterium]
MRAVAIRDDSIRLGQFLKLAGMVDSGSEAKLLLEDEQVRVNDVTETRRGRRLRIGDRIAVAGDIAKVVAWEATAP